MIGLHSPEIPRVQIQAFRLDAAENRASLGKITPMSKDSLLSKQTSKIPERSLACRGIRRRMLKPSPKLLKRQVRWLGQVYALPASRSVGGLRITLLLGFCLNFVGPIAFGATWFVDSRATGLGNGTSWANAWTNVSNISGVTAGDKVYISGGASGSSQTYTLSAAWNPPSGSARNRITYQIGQDSAHNGLAIFNGGGGATWLGSPSYVNIIGDAGDGRRHFQVTGCSILITPSYSGSTPSFDQLRLAYIECTNGLGVAGNVCFRNNGGATRIEIDHNHWLVGIVGTRNLMVFHNLVDSGWDSSLLIHDNTFVVPYSTTELLWGCTCCFIDGGGASFYNNLVLGFPMSGNGGNHMTGWQSGAGSHFKVYNNTFVNMGNMSVYGEAWEGSNPTYRDVLVFNNLCMVTDPLLNTSYPCGILFKPNVTPALFTNVVIANNLAADIVNRAMALCNDEGFSNITFTNCRLENNITVNCPFGITTDNNTTSIIDHNAVLSASNGASEFVNYSTYGGTNNNFHLSSGASTLIGQGTNLSAYFATDRDGNLRGLPWDIGAFRFTGSASGAARPLAPTNSRVIGN